MLVIMGLSETKGLFVSGIVRRVTVLIDGGYFLKRLPQLRPDLNTDATTVARALNKIVGGHLHQLNKTYRQDNPWSMLYRVFYYDAQPFEKSTEYPISKQRLDFSKTDEAKFRRNLFEAVRHKRKFALRLGKVHRENGWRLTEVASKKLRNGKLDPASLTDGDFTFGLRQKGVDMRIGIDISSIALKKQADTIILVAGDSDFVPTAKLARREGLEIILDPMRREVSPDLFEHIDGLYSGLPNKPRNAEEVAANLRAAPQAEEDDQ